MLRLAGVSHTFTSMGRESDPVGGMPRAAGWSPSSGWTAGPASSANRLGRVDVVHDAYAYRPRGFNEGRRLLGVLLQQLGLLAGGQLGQRNFQLDDARPGDGVLENLHVFFAHTGNGSERREQRPGGGLSCSFKGKLNTAPQLGIGLLEP